MIEVLDGISTYAAYVDPAFPKAWTSIIVDSVFKDILNNGHPIFLGVGKERHLLLPKGRTVKEVHDELSDFMFKLGEKNNGSSLIYY